MNEKIYRDRRVKLASMMGDGLAVVTSATGAIRSNDTEFEFRQDSNFYYLSGLKEQDSVIVIKKEHGSVSTYLFLKSVSDSERLWSGDRLEIEAARETLSFDEVFEICDFKSKIGEFLLNLPRLYIDLFSTNLYIDIVKESAKELKSDRASKKSVREFVDVVELIGGLRIIKDKYEIELIERGLQITADAHHRAMSKCRVGIIEHEVCAELEYIFAKHGAVPAYGGIVAGGDRANTLHYIDNNCVLEDGDLLLVDAGCEFEMYATDVTRTYPISGTFSDDQKYLYEMLLELQVELIEMVAPDVLRSSLQEHMQMQICKILANLGVTDLASDRAFERGVYKKYIPHGVGHWMGIDVHDRCAYFDEQMQEIPLKEGMVLTIEPAIYLSKSDMRVPPQYRGIGIRVEDDILVTKDGYQNLSANIVKSVEEIERVCRARSF